MITKRQKAISNGDKFYFTGKPCSRNHVVKRYTTTRDCISCRKINSKISNAANAEAKNLSQIKRRKANPGLASHERILWKMNKTGQMAPGADAGLIYRKYKLAAILTKRRGTQYHVDHIIPLNGKTISGLHHQDNLQVITAEANRAKGNKYELKS